MCELIVIDQGNFHKKEIDLIFTNALEMAHLPESTESQLDQSVDFINSLALKIRTYSESLQNFRLYDISQGHLASILKSW